MNMHFKSLKLRYGTSQFGSTILPLLNKTATEELKQMLERTKAEERMRNAAVNGVDTDASGVLADINQDHNERQHRACTEASKELAAKQSVIDGLRINEIDAPLEIADAIAHAEEAASVHHDSCVQACTEEHRKRLELNAFKAKYNIQREAIHPNVTTTIAWVVTFALIEFMAGVLLYKDVSNDRTQTFMTAALAAGSMAAAGFGLGFSGIFGLNGQGVRRLMGTVGMAVTACAIWTFSLMVAHDRDHLATYQAGEDFVRRFDSQIIFKPWEWFSFETIQGPCFLIISLTVAALAAVKGYRGIMDPIPGYGAVDTKWRVAANIANERLDARHAAARAPIDAKIEEMDQKKEQDASKVTAARKAVSAAEQIGVQYNTTIAITLDIRNAAVQAGKDAWLKVRPEIPSYLVAAIQTDDTAPTPNPSVDDVRRDADLLAVTHDANNRARVEVLTDLTTYRKKAAADWETNIRNIRDLGLARAKQYAAITHAELEG